MFSKAKHRNIILIVSLLEDVMTKTNARIDIPTILSWIFSIIGLFFSFMFLFVNLIGAVVMLLSSLIIFPPTRRLYATKLPLRLRFAYILSTILVLFAFIYTSSNIKIDFDTSVKRFQPTELSFTSEKPEINIAYKCASIVKSILINDENVSDETRKKICDEGFAFKLNDGSNQVTVSLTDGEKTLKEEFKVSFDEKAYLQRIEDENKRIAEQEAKQKAEQEAQAKLEADKKANEEANKKAEQEAIAKEEARKKAEADEIARREALPHFSNGTFMVNKEIEPGTYRTREGISGCYFERLSGFGGEIDDIITNANASYPEVITISKSDKGFTTRNCGTWTKDLSRITESKTQFSDGNYIVNTDITPGTYKNTGGSGCYYERERGFGGTIEDIIANNNTSSTTIVTIAKTDKGFLSHGCGVWKKL